jgi:hypothetical protein
MLSSQIAPGRPSKSWSAANAMTNTTISSTDTCRSNGLIAVSN